MAGMKSKVQTETKTCDHRENACCLEGNWIANPTSADKLPPDGSATPVDYAWSADFEALDIRLSKTICQGLISKVKLASQPKFTDSHRWRDTLPSEEIIECH
jgi:hypothetical protein